MGNKFMTTTYTCIYMPIRIRVSDNVGIWISVIGVQYNGHGPL